jgi:hypothetical protein
MNYIADTNPTMSPLTPAQITTITGQTTVAPQNITYSPTQNTDVSLLSMTPNLSLAQTTITVTTNNSNTQDAFVVEYGLNIADITGNPNHISPGIWDMNLYAKANANNDKDNIGFRFWLIGETAGGSRTNLVANGSDIAYVYENSTSQQLTMSLYIQSVIDITPYTKLLVVLTSRNRNATSHTAQVYFQSNNTYSHIHTSLGIPGVTGPTGITGPAGPQGPSGGGADPLTISSLYVSSIQSVGNLFINNAADNVAITVGDLSGYLFDYVLSTFTNTGGNVLVTTQSSIGLISFHETSIYSLSSIYISADCNAYISSTDVDIVSYSNIRIDSWSTMLITAYNELNMSVQSNLIVNSQSTMTLFSPSITFNTDNAYITGALEVHQVQTNVNPNFAPSGTVDYDWRDFDVFRVDGITNNWTANIINLPTTNYKSYGLVFILRQGNDPGFIDTLQINSNATTILWPNATAPTPTANRTEVESFTLYYDSVWTALGTYTSFG